MNPPSFQINISDAAYLCVELPDASYVYTLGRQFNIDPTGILITEEGYPFYPHITLALPYSNPVNITETGIVLELIGGMWTSMGQIKAIIFEHPELLQSLGNGYFKDTPGSGTPLIGNPGDPPPFDNVKIYYHTIQNPQIFYPHVVMKVVINDCKAILELARTVVDSMTDNIAEFPMPDPALSAITAQANQLEHLISEVESGNHQKISLRNEAAATLYHLLQDETIYVNKTGNGIKGILEQSGFTIIDPPDPRPVPEQVVIKRIEQALTQNTIKIYINSMIQKTLTFSVQASTNPADDTSWKQLLVTTNSHELLIPNRIHGEEVWYRINATNASGTGMWSTPVSFIYNA